MPQKQIKSAVWDYLATLQQTQACEEKVEMHQMFSKKTSSLPADQCMYCIFNGCFKLCS